MRPMFLSEVEHSHSGGPRLRTARYPREVNCVAHSMVMCGGDRLIREEKAPNYR